MLIYISGKYSGDIDANIEAARKVAFEVWSMGHFALCPHMNTAHGEIDAPTVAYGHWLAGDCRILEGCDAMLLLPGWEDSHGALVEMKHAEALDIPVYYYPDIPKLA